MHDPVPGPFESALVRTLSLFGGQISQQAPDPTDVEKYIVIANDLDPAAGLLGQSHEHLLEIRCTHRSLAASGACGQECPDSRTLTAVTNPPFGRNIAVGDDQQVDLSATEGPEDRRCSCHHEGASSQPVQEQARSPDGLCDSAQKPFDRLHRLRLGARDCPDTEETSRCVCDGACAVEDRLPLPRRPPGESDVELPRVEQSRR